MDSSKYPWSEKAPCAWLPLSWGLDKRYREIKEDEFGKFPYAGGGWGLVSAECMCPGYPAGASFPPSQPGSTQKPPHLFQQLQMPLNCINDN